MNYLLQIGFDNSRRLSRKEYLLEYRGVRFKLVQRNPKKWSDALLTIVPEMDGAATELAFARAAEFLSALAWQNHSMVAFWQSGAHSWPGELSLDEAKPFMSEPPRIPGGGTVLGYDPIRIPHVKTDEQRIALALFREAYASNNDYLSFLFYWQVLEVRGQKPEDVVDKTWRKDRACVRLPNSDIDNLPLAGQTLGHYLLDDCRHAIAHIRRKYGKKTLDLDKPAERNRLTYSTRVIKAFAECYIRQILGLTEHLYLVRGQRNEFPTFADIETIGSGHFKQAYPSAKLPRRFIPRA
jgi:hypothetical protein